MPFDQDTDDPSSSMQPDWPKHICLSTWSGVIAKLSKLVHLIEMRKIDCFGESRLVLHLAHHHYCYHCCCYYCYYYSYYDVDAGLMLVLLYGREGWFAPLIRATGFNIVFAFPGPRHLSLPLRQGILQSPCWSAHQVRAWRRLVRNSQSD